MPLNDKESKQRWLLPWGKVSVKQEQESLGFFVLGNRGAGKSTWLEVMMSAVFRYVGTAPNHRGIVFDSKPDQSSGIVPSLEAQGIKNKILNPLDERCCGWAIGKDVQTQPSAIELTAFLIPEAEQQKDNKYFIDSARLLVQAAIYTLIKVKGDTFTLRDIILASTNKDDFKDLLKKHHPHYSTYLEYLKEGNGKKNEVLTTIIANLSLLETIAAQWEGAKHQFSITDWLTDAGSVLIFGADPAHPVLLKRINHLMFRFLAVQLMGLDDDQNRRIWMFIDELAKVSPLPELENILTLARSKGICTVLATQNIEALIDKIGKEKTEVILGLCGWKAIFGVDPTTADFLSKYINDFEWYQTTYNKSFSSGSNGASSTSGVSYSINNRRTITAQELMDINSLPTGPEHGLGGYFIAPYKGVYRHRYSWDEIESMRIERVDYVSAYERADSTTLKHLEPWSDEERAALGLSPISEQKQ